ncbi:MULTISPECIES: nucleoid-associated protein [unclassified Kaistella]|uniref:nucleoid-associated protein n=1 Tax=unclassified Kaistella TaxID=2762626 RepID=UPI0027325232|nr:MULTISPECIES: nucleoid-associated protein [unclassified Kaistella]MDP2454706.1 nucleoid-associated protein [Kaistella sp. SH11-4b]MDP2457443.1 nucleoid-associated protein [Kaistella sp. SH40-3]MDP2460203.1 nucleoid-associated protein [Kaistella sp. SH19-2b]
MAKIKRWGENLDVKNIVIHQLLKESGDRLVKAKLSENLLHIGDKEKVFLGNLDHSYHKKSNPIYGIFANEYPHFKTLLKSYLSGEIEFFEFSVEVTNYYETVLKRTPASTGGFMILCEYTNTTTNCDLLLVLMINNKDGYLINEEDLTLENVKNLDLSKVDVACIINLTDWAKIEDAEPTDRTTYLSFVKGLKEVSFYFMSFIDVNNKNTSSESTSRLVRAIDDYADRKGWDRDTKINKRNRVFTHCEECMNAKREILLSSISPFMNEENPQDFEDFCMSDDYKVSAIISGDRTKMRNLKTIIFADKQLKIEFDTKLVLDELIILSPNEKNLTIKNISPLLRDKILALTKNA